MLIIKIKFMKIKICRNCGSKKLVKLFSLGNLSYSGFFPKHRSTKVEKKKFNFSKVFKLSSCSTR